MRMFPAILLALAFTGCEQKAADDALTRAVTAEKESAALKSRITDLEKQVAALSLPVAPKLQAPAQAVADFADAYKHNDTEGMLKLAEFEPSQSDTQLAMLSSNYSFTDIRTLNVFTVKQDIQRDLCAKKGPDCGAALVLVERTWANGNDRLAVLVVRHDGTWRVQADVGNKVFNWLREM